MPPNLMWGTDGVRVFTVDDGWGWIFTAVEHWNAECVGWHVCKRGDRFAALQPISMGLAGLYGSTAAGRGSGAGLADGSRLPVSVGPLHQPDQVLGHPAVLRLRRRAPDQRRRRAVQSHAEGIDHPWSHLPQHRGAAGRRPRLRRTLQCPVDRRKERLPEPRSSSSGVARRDLKSGPPRETNLCPRNRVRYKRIKTEAEPRAARSTRRRFGRSTSRSCCTGRCSC